MGVDLQHTAHKKQSQDSGTSVGSCHQTSPAGRTAGCGQTTVKTSATLSRTEAGVTKEPREKKNSPVVSTAPYPTHTYIRTAAPSGNLAATVLAYQGKKAPD